MTCTTATHARNCNVMWCIAALAHQLGYYVDMDGLECTGKRMHEGVIVLCYCLGLNLKCIVWVCRGVETDVNDNLYASENEEIRNGADVSFPGQDVFFAYNGMARLQRLCTLWLNASNCDLVALCV